MIRLKRGSTPEFGAWISRLREERGAGTQVMAAEKIGCSRVQLARWESGASLPSGKFIRAIADLYGIDVNEVARRAGYPVTSEGILSDWTMSIARRIERRTQDLPKTKKDALERAIDNILSVAV